MTEKAFCAEIHRFLRFFEKLSLADRDDIVAGLKKIEFTLLPVAPKGGRGMGGRQQGNSGGSR